MTSGVNAVPLRNIYIRQIIDDAVKWVLSVDPSTQLGFYSENKQDILVSMILLLVYMWLAVNVAASIWSEHVRLAYYNP